MMNIRRRVVMGIGFLAVLGAVSASVVVASGSSADDSSVPVPPVTQDTTVGTRPYVGPSGVGEVVDTATLRWVAGSGAVSVFRGEGVMDTTSPDCLVVVDPDGASVGCVPAGYDLAARPRVMTAVQPTGRRDAVVLVDPSVTEVIAGDRAITPQNGVVIVTGDGRTDEHIVARSPGGDVGVTLEGIPVDIPGASG
jgi:hypothetical protein